MDESISSLPSTFNRHKWPAIVTFISVIVGAVAYLVISPRLYESNVRLILDGKQASISNLGRELTTETTRTDVSPIADQAEIAQSWQVLRQARAQVLPPQTNAEQAEKKLKLEQIKDDLKVKIVPSTNILEISYHNRDPLLTAQLLNAIAQSMVSENAQTLRSAAGAARKFLEVEVPQKRSELAQVEAKISQYKQTEGILSLADNNGQDNAQTKSLVESLADLENQERSLSAQIQEVKQRNNSLQQITDSNTLKSTYSAVRGGQNQELQELRKKLVDLESRVALARSRFKEDSPPVLNLVEERNATRKLYAEEIARLSGNNTPVNLPDNSIAADNVSQDLATQLILGEVELSALEGKLSVISSERAKLQERQNQLPVREQGLAELVRQRQEAARSLEFLQRQLEEARIAEAQVGRSLRIIDLAEPSTSPSWPKVPVVIVIAVGAGLVLAIGVVLLLELLDGTLRNATEAEKLVKLPVLGVLPILPDAGQELAPPNILQQNHALLESYRSLLKSMQIRNGEDLRVIVVSSTLSGEGKSVVASRLAAVSAMLSRRTLLIDADLRRPTQHKLFDLEIKPGLTDLVKGNYTLAEAVQRTNIRNLSVISSGKPHSNPSEMFESKKIHSIITEAAAHYDLVIIDTPPVTSCADALALCCEDERMLLVTRPNFTQKDILMRAVSELTSNRINILGVAINGMTTQTEKFYRYALEGYQPTNTDSNR